MQRNDLNDNIEIIATTFFDNDSDRKKFMKRTEHFKLHFNEPYVKDKSKEQMIDILMQIANAIHHSKRKKLSTLRKKTYSSSGGKRRTRR